MRSSSRSTSGGGRGCWGGVHRRTWADFGSGSGSGCGCGFDCGCGGACGGGACGCRRRCFGAGRVPRCKRSHSDHLIASKCTALDGASWRSHSSYLEPSAGIDSTKLSCHASGTSGGPSAPLTALLIIFAAILPPARGAPAAAAPGGAGGRVLASIALPLLRIRPRGRHRSSHAGRERGGAPRDRIRLRSQPPRPQAERLDGQLRTT